MMEEKYNITHVLVPNGDRTRNRSSHIRPETVCIYVETPINPTMEFVDLDASRQSRKKHGLK